MQLNDRLYNLGCCPHAESTLLPNSVVGCVGYNGALDFVCRISTSLAHTRNQTLDHPAHSADTGLTVLSLATEGVSTKMCV
jgi:hypothetical protein